MINELENLCKKFRQALERIDKNSLPITFLKFPRGSCGDASILLGQYLYDNGMGQFDYVCGIKDGQSHAWLEKDGTIIDITADQFSEISETVIVTKNRSWHDSFSEDLKKRPALINIYDERTKFCLDFAYKNLNCYLKE